MPGVVQDVIGFGVLRVPELIRCFSNSLNDFLGNEIYLQVLLGIPDELSRINTA